MAWRSAVVPVSARGVVRVPGSRESEPSEPPPGDGWEQSVATIVQWCEADSGPLWLVEGPTGSGKTRLAEEVAHRLTSRGWACGWARPGLGTFAVTAAARNGARALVLVDDAETRADLGDVLRTLAGASSPLSVRVLMLTRDCASWWQATLDQLAPLERAALNPGRLRLAPDQVEPPSPRALALRSAALATTGTKADTVAMLAAADPATGAVLLRQAALVVALSTRVGQLGPAEVRSALRDLFEEQEGYWRRAAEQLSGPGLPNPSLRSALATSVVVGSDGVNDAATVLRRVPALAVGAADRLARLAMWWHGLYSRTGSSSVPTPQLPAWLADRLPDSRSGERSGISWTVAALDAERRATSTLARLALAAHRDIWPAAAKAAEQSGALVRQREADEAHAALRQGIDAVSPVDEALAWLSRELELTDEEVEHLGDAISYPSGSMARTAIVLAKRLLENAHDEADRAAFLLTLGARHGELGQWAEARDHSAAAAAILRGLAVGEQRAAYLPDLAAAVGNLASCLARLEEFDAAVSTGYEAVALHRELVATDREAHLPDLARSLVNLSASLKRAGRLEAAAGAAGQAVVHFRELVAHSPGSYAAELAAAEHNWSVCDAALSAQATAAIEH